MADTLKATFKASVSGTYINTLANSAEPVSVLLEKAVTLTTTDGTTTGKADKMWSSKARSLSGASSESIDVYDLGTIDIGTGSGKDALGNSITFAEIVAVLIENNSSSTGNMTIGGEGSAAAWQTPFGASDGASVGPIPPGGFFMFGSTADPAFAVTDSSDHLLKIASSATLTYDIYIIGRSA